MRRSLGTAIAATALALPLAAQASFELPKNEDAAPRALDLAPDPSLTPHQVVEIQLGALAANAEWGDDAGIALTFRFASPDNQRMTGPLARFSQMVRSTAYAPLLNHETAQIGPIHMHHGSALLPVLLRDAQGVDHGYIWVLSRQEGGPFDGAWMTDAVYPSAPAAVQEGLPKKTDI